MDEVDQVTAEFHKSVAGQHADVVSLQTRGQELPLGTESLVSSSPKVMSGKLDRNPEWVIRRILVPTNFSNASNSAIQRAVELANQCDAVLTILHVIDINAPDQPGGAEALMRRLWNEGSSRMAQLACSLVGRVEAQTMLTEGLPAEVIIEKSSEFDVVVIAKSSGKRAWRLFSKHTARRVMEHAACPVMVLHE
jgi:nucleotide-binding universal stress UspA family protein